MKTIIQILKGLAPKVVAIDGVDGSRKSTLASEIIKAIEFDHVELDKFLKKNRGSFINNLNYQEIKIRITQSQTPIIIEGVCLLSVLEKLNLTSEVLIYNKRMPGNRFWKDEKKCEIDGNIEQFIVEENRVLKEFGEIAAGIDGKPFDPKECRLSQLDEEIIRYHHQYQPHKRADVIFKITDN